MTHLTLTSILLLLSLHLLLRRAAALSYPPPPPTTPKNATLEYMDPTLPPLLLPTETPKCTLLVLQHDFAPGDSSFPATANYSPPSGCPSPWSRVVLDLSASASDLQRDRTASVSLDGAEILRTTTPLPLSPGVFWRLRKDITRYTSLLSSSVDDSILSMMMEADDKPSSSSLQGVYSVNISLHFYRGGKPNLSAAADAAANPADVIIPISGDCGGWFRLQKESDTQTASISVPTNTYRAVLELYVSPHAGDAQWYANPLRSAGGGGGGSAANGGFRQVIASIDGRYAGSAVPFPVIYPRSINPYLWAPVAAIGAYDHPSYDLDLTPFLGFLIDGKDHEIGLSLRDAQPYWLISANLHVWVDALSDGVEAALVRQSAPPLRLSREANWKGCDGKSAVDGQVIERISGWVSSSRGNVTTSIRRSLKFKSRVEVHGGGSSRRAAMEVKERTDVRVGRERVVVEREAPMEMVTVRSNGGGGSVLEKTRVTHGMTERRSVAAEGREAVGGTVADWQEAEGSVLVQEGEAVWGVGDSRSSYRFRDAKGCYLRTVNAVGGRVQEDVETASCAAVADA